MTHRMRFRTWTGLGLAGCLLLTGCELTRPNFQMNSNSTMPFFGIDLIPRRSTTSIDPQTAPKAPEQSAQSEVKPVSDVQPRSKFWNSFSFRSEKSEPTPIPLATPGSDHPINRGPVELLP